MKAKSIFESKTMWFNVVSAVLAFVSSGHLPAGSEAYVPLIMAAGNLVLRCLTTGPVSLTGK